MLLLLPIASSIAERSSFLWIFVKVSILSKLVVPVIVSGRIEEAIKINMENENDLYEYDYIIDINSIEELTFYIVKRSEIFDEDFSFVLMRLAEKRYIPTPDPKSIFDFIADVLIITKMEKEVIILALIYIERFIFNTGLLLTSRNFLTS